MVKNILNILCLTIVLYQISSAQPKESSNIAYHFPKDWLGAWEGTLQIYKNQNIVQSIPISLEHFLMDSIGNYSWSILYGSGSNVDKRSYLLKPADVPTGHFIIDEQNGIKLDGYLFENKYISSFEVMGNQLVTIYELIDEKMMQFEVFVNKSQAVNITGDLKTENAEEVPQVKSFPVIGYQKAILHKKSLSK